MIGALLGRGIEEELWRSIQLFGDNPSAFFLRPLTGTLTVITLFFIGLQIRQTFRKPKKQLS